MPKWIANDVTPFAETGFEIGVDYRGTANDGSHLLNYHLPKGFSMAVPRRYTVSRRRID